MRYQNTDTKKRLVSIRQIKTWVQPNEVVSLSSIDIRFLGNNGVYLIKVPNATRPGLREKKVEVQKENKEKAEKVKKEKISIKSVIKNVFKKVMQ